MYRISLTSGWKLLGLALIASLLASTAWASKREAPLAMPEESPMGRDQANMDRMGGELSPKFIQHLYNEVALLRAEEDLEAAEDWLMEKFREDARFEFVFVPVWKQFHEEKEVPDRYPLLLAKIRGAIDTKMKTFPEQADYWRFVRGIYQTPLRNADRTSAVSR